MEAVPPLSLPPLTTPFDLPHLGHDRPLWCIRPLTIYTLPHDGHWIAILFPSQSSESLVLSTGLSFMVPLKGLFAGIKVFILSATIPVLSKRGARTLFPGAPFQAVSIPPASVPAVGVFLEICTSIRCIRMLGNYLLALACAEPTSQHVALPSQPLTFQLAFGKIYFELPHHQRLLRRLINLCSNGQATKHQLILCSFLNIFIY